VLLLGGFVAGLLHPVLTPTHALALAGLGLLIGQQPAGKRWRLAVLFVVALAAGLVALALAVGETPANDVLLGAAAIAGVLVAAALRLPQPLVGPLAVLMGAAIGLDSPPEMISLDAAVAMLIGTGVGALIALVLVIAAVTWLRRDWQQIGVRVLGSWIAASALLAIAVRFAR
jgi:urease accessory protein